MREVQQINIYHDIAIIHKQWFSLRFQQRTQMHGRRTLAVVKIHQYHRKSTLNASFYAGARARTMNAVIFSLQESFNAMIQKKSAEKLLLLWIRQDSG